jgi:hypothetical protein
MAVLTISRKFRALDDFADQSVRSGYCNGQHRQLALLDYLASELSKGLKAELGECISVASTSFFYSLSRSSKVTSMTFSGSVTSGMVMKLLSCPNGRAKKHVAVKIGW